MRFVINKGIYRNLLWGRHVAQGGRGWPTYKTVNSKADGRPYLVRLSEK